MGSIRPELEPKDQAMKVTREWLKKYATKGIGYNKQQIEALCMTYPPKAGWIDALCGTELSDGCARKFEAAAGQSLALIDRARGIEKMKTERVYYTMPDGKGSFMGRWLEPHENDTWPGPETFKNAP